MSVEIATRAGPLPRDELRWVADLYGRADPKYRRDDVLEHLFLQSPAGPGLHAFSLDAGRPVGHCSVVPMRARRGGEEILCGKLEALYLEPEYRGVQPDGSRIVRSLLDTLYAFAFGRGIVLIHAYVSPPVGRVIEFEALPGIGERTFVAWLPAAGTATITRAFAAAQRAARAAAAAAGTVPIVLRQARPDDVDLVEAPLPRDGRWGIAAADSWDWFSRSPLVGVCDTDGGRALVQIPASPLDPLRLVAWRPELRGLGAAIRLLRGLARVAADTGARSIRFQPWASSAADGDLRRACRLLGFVRRDDFTTLYVRTQQPELARADAVVPTPLLYLGF